MTGLQRWIRNFFGFSRKETNGFIILLLLMALVVFSTPVSKLLITSQPDDLTSDWHVLDSITAQWEQGRKDSTIQVVSKLKAHAFVVFNPNSANDKVLSTLGFSTTLTKRIINYRSKGGRFMIKSDLLKIYGMDSTLYRQLYNYIDLPDHLQLESFKKHEGEEKRVTNKIKFDLNLADTIQLKTIYGIGPVLAKRIVKYRSSLGGFIDKHQLNEIYGLDSLIVERLLKSTFLDQHFKPAQININTADERELDIHPYITKPIAKAIVSYRFQHGKFNQVMEIQNLQLIDEETGKKITPYIKITD